MSGTLVVFLHGINSDAAIWRSLEASLRSNPDLTGIRFDPIPYETTLRPSWMARLAGLFTGGHNLRVEDPSSLFLITDGIRQNLRRSSRNIDDTVIIGHSMGGLIARQLAIDQVKNLSARDDSRGPMASISSLILMAVPIEGAHIANVGRRILRDNTQLTQLSVGADFINQQNRDWEALKVEEHVRTHYFVGQKDSVVPPDLNKTSRSNYHVIMGADHNTLYDSTIFPEIALDIADIIQTCNPWARMDFLPVEYAAVEPWAEDPDFEIAPADPP
jgi:pimeloyl-ACP methyl ester carboxylesterase